MDNNNEQGTGDPSIAVSIVDGQMYDTHRPILNDIFGYGYEGHGQATAQWGNEATVVWFPGYDVKGMDPLSGDHDPDWHNILSPDGTTMWERTLDGGQEDEQAKYTRITFGYRNGENPRRYHFIGVFKYVRTTIDNGCRVYEYRRVRTFLTEAEARRGSEINLELEGSSFGQ